MPTTSQPSADELRSAVELAVRAPSIHNTQPWRWAIRPDGLDLHADRTRQLPVADPDGHNLLVSCGAALGLARLALAGAGHQTEVVRAPDPADPDLLARITVTGSGDPAEDARQRATAARERHSDRRPFLATPVSDELLQRLAESVTDDGVYLNLAERSDERLDLAVLVSRADQTMASDPAYREELAKWIRPAAADDGIPATAVPHLTGAEPRHSDVPMRDFEAGITGTLPVQGGQKEDPALGVIMSTDHGVGGTLRAGEALSRLLVEVQLCGLAASIISQPVDWPVIRERMRNLMGWRDYPHILVRIGWPVDGDVATATPRRATDDVIASDA